MRNISGHVAVAKLLVENGANVNAQKNGGARPLEAVSWNGETTGKSFKK